MPLAEFASYNSAVNLLAARVTAGVRTIEASGWITAAALISPSKAADMATMIVMAIAVTMDRATDKLSHAHPTTCTGTIAR